MKQSVVYQDNKSSILLETNGRASSSKRTRHIDIRYFFVSDRVQKKEVSIKYCSTLNMIADYFTKPLQGALFRRFRDFILGLTDNGNALESSTMPQECVGPTESMESTESAKENRWDRQTKMTTANSSEN